MEVSETDSRKSGERKVRHDQHIVEPRVVLELEMVDEAYVLSLNSIKSCEVKVWWKFGFGQIAEDEPKDSNEITNCQNNDDKLESLEEVRDHQDQHDIVVV
jgi:hypothetical protein